MTPNLSKQSWGLSNGYRHKEIVVMRFSYKLFILIYLVFITILCFFMFPSHDLLFYYYPWSLNLQLSYYDGPPLIAYIIRLFTMLFGHNIFSLNFFGVGIAIATCYVIIKIGELLHSHHFGIVAACMWLVYPFSTTRFIFATLNYDCLDNLFSLFCILFILCYLKNYKTIYLYLAGVAAGMGLLSKYTVVVAILGLIVYFILRQRKVFLRVHVYIAIMLGIILFAPVLIWNYSHNWASFKYQLGVHSWAATQHSSGHAGISGVWFYICSDVLGVMHISILILLAIWWKHRTHASTVGISNKEGIQLLWIVCIAYFIFWLSLAYHAHVAMNYLLFPDSLLIILTCYYLYYYNYFKAINIFNILFVLTSMIMLINRTFIAVPEPSDLNKLQQLQLQHHRWDFNAKNEN